MQVLVDMAGGNDGMDGKQHEPETLAMVAWALGFFAERFKNHGDSIIFLGDPSAPGPFPLVPIWPSPLLGSE